MCKSIEWNYSLPVWEASPNVIAAWAFGSAQDGMVRPGSDVDIGILAQTLPGLEEQLDLLIRLQDTLGFEDIDLVILNDANPILRFEAISGRLLFCRDVGRRVEFVSLSAREYEDAMAFWQRSLRDWQPVEREKC